MKNEQNPAIQLLHEKLSTQLSLMRNKKIAIFGAGRAGRLFYQFLQRWYRDIEVVFFADNYQTGVCEELDVVDKRGMLSRRDSIDYVVVVSSYHSEIYADLAMEEGLEILVIPEHFIAVFEDIFINEYQPCSDNPDCQKYADKFSAVMSLLAVDVERNLYDVLTCAEMDALERDHYVMNHYLAHGYKTQYLDFVLPEEFKVIIEGGIHDGKTTLSFMEITNGKAMLYGFDPLIGPYNDSEYAEKVKAYSSVKILPLGLWSSEKQLNIVDQGDASYVLDGDVGELESEVINVTTVDIFTQQENLPSVDFIKLDVEGAEMDVLRGAAETLRKHRPQLAIAIYHKPSDFYDIPLYLDSVLDNYTYHLGHYNFGRIETVWYAIPDELYKNK